MTYMIECKWVGGYASARGYEHVVHREYTASRKFADRVEKLRHIFFTDGTRLDIEVTRRSRSDGRRMPAIDGYGPLIRKCLRYGNRVSDFPPEPAGATA